MAGKYHQIQISCGWKMFISLQDSVSQEETDEIFRLADLLCDRFQTLFGILMGLKKCI